MKQLWLLVLGLVLVPCAPSEGAIQTALAETEAAMPTATDKPTNTPEPTETPDICNEEELTEWFVLTQTIADEAQELTGDFLALPIASILSEAQGYADEAIRLQEMYELGSHPPDCAKGMQANMKRYLAELAAGFQAMADGDFDTEHFEEADEAKSALISQIENFAYDN